MFSRTAPDLGRLVGRQILRKDMKLTGESGLQYVLTDNLAGVEGHVWIAKDARNKKPSWFVVKQPKWPYINKAGSWAERLREFEHEVKMNEIFQGAKYIRQQADTIEPTSEDDPPRMVLEALWDSVARVYTTRMFTRTEIKAIMKTTLQALQEVEQKDFMHPGLSMGNVLISTPRLDPYDPARFIAKIANPISFVEPNRVYEGKKFYPWPTNAPEMLFSKPVSFPAHIWSWGIILCHLLESRSAWMRDRAESMYIGGLLQSHEDPHNWWEGYDVVRSELVTDFNLKQCKYYTDCRLPKGLPGKDVGWKQHLLNKGLGDDDVCFLDWVLDPNPETRPTSEQIMQSGFLEWVKEDDDDQSSWHEAPDAPAFEPHHQQASS